MPEQISEIDGRPLTLTAAADGLRDGSWTATELLAGVERRADVLDPVLGTYVHRSDETARRCAAQADEDFEAGVDRGPLQGIPLGVKDILSTRDAPTRAQSRVLRAAFGEQDDAVSVSRLRAAGAVITGKVSTMEYATGTPDMDNDFPIPRNPFDADRWPGGSSSGSGSGVQAAMFLGALGTDTGGSICLPAAWSGVSGLKPTYGLVPKTGCVPLGWTYDTVGPLARSAADCAHLLDAIAGHDPSDASSADGQPMGYATQLTGSVKGLRIGIDRNLLIHPECDPAIHGLMSEAISVFEAGGATVVDVRLPLYDELTAATVVGMVSEALAYHRTDLRKRWDNFGPGTRMVLASAVMNTATDYIQAQRVRRAGVVAARALFREVDLTLTPTCLTPAPLLKGMDFGSIVAMINTRYWNALGFPAMSIPLGLNASGLPLGMHLGGRPFNDGLVLRAADHFQSVTRHHLREPPLVAQTLAAHPQD